MELAPAVLLVGLGGIGLYALGRTAVEQRALTRAGFRQTDDEGDSRLSEDLVAFAVTMTMIGVVFQSTPALLDEAAAIRDSLQAGSLPWSSSAWTR